VEQEGILGRRFLYRQGNVELMQLFLVVKNTTKNILLIEKDCVSWTYQVANNVESEADERLL